LLDLLLKAGERANYVIAILAGHYLVRIVVGKAEAIPATHSARQIDSHINPAPAGAR
jgi:hypothetical protein